VSIEILPILSIMRFKQAENDTNSVVIAKVALVPNHNWTVTAPPFKTLPTYRVAQKFGTIILYALTLPNINQFFGPPCSRSHSLSCILHAPLL